MKKKVILIGILALIVIAFGVWKWTFRPAETDVSGHKTDMAINATDLVLQFTQNEDSANARYLNKVIEITGTVDTIAMKEEEVSVYLKENNAISGVLCSFNKKSFNSDFIKKGDKITLKGVCSGYLMDVVMNKCSLQ